MTAPIVFLDTETTGLSPDAHIWELAMIRRQTSGKMEKMEGFVQHDVRLANNLPQRFREDHQRRYIPELAMDEKTLVEVVMDMFRRDDAFAPKPHAVGAVPNFDTERIARILARHGHEPPWHHHLIDAETLAVGYLYGLYVADGLAQPSLPGLPWDSDDLSLRLGVNPLRFDRHTALGDTEWAMAIYDAVTGYGGEQQGSPEGGEQHA